MNFQLRIGAEPEQTLVASCSHAAFVRISFRIFLRLASDPNSLEKSHMKIKLSFAILLLTLGCASSEAYEKILNTWVGDTEGVVSKWGPSQNVYTSPDGNRILTYYSQRTMVMPGYTGPSTTYLSGYNYNGGFSGTATAYQSSAPPIPIDMRCQTNFTVNQGRIVSWSYKGNDCKA